MINFEKIECKERYINNYDYIIEIVNKMMKKLYSVIEEYLEYIFNAPSTVNKVITYYRIGYNPSEPHKEYIYFKDILVKEFELVLPKYNKGIEELK